ncbi:MAG: hypothetical protein ABR563_13925, partial [Pyrinomonadaceae bacterium]
MRTPLRSVAVAFALLCAMSAAALAKKTVNEIKADPGRYRNKTVSVEGRVTDSYGVLGNGAYEI